MDFWESIATALITEAAKGAAGAYAGQSEAETRKEAETETQKLRNEGEMAVAQLTTKAAMDQLEKTLAQKAASDLLSAKTGVQQTALSGIPQGYRNLLEALVAAQQMKSQGWANTGLMGQRAAMRKQSIE